MIWLYLLKLILVSVVILGALVLLSGDDPEDQVKPWKRR